VLIVAPLDNEGELVLLLLQLHVEGGEGLVLLLLGVHLFLVLVGFFLSDTKVVLGAGKCGFLHLNFVLELGDLMTGNFEFALELRNLVLTLNQVLGIQVTVGSDSLVQVLLRLKFRFKINVLLLKLTDQVLLQFDFLNHLHQVGVGFGGFQGELVALLLELSGFGGELVLDLAVRIGLLAHSLD